MNDCSEDLMPRNAPRPAPLIEITAKPLVPEVSLLLDQEKNKSFHLPAPSAQRTEDKSGNKFKNQNQNEITLGNQFESYNSWKAKNAEVLHTVTGSVGRTEAASKHTGLSRKPNSVKKRPVTATEIYYSQESEFETSSPIETHIREISNKNCTSKVYKRNQALYANDRDNSDHQYSCSVNHQISKSSNKPAHVSSRPPNDKYPLTKTSENHPQMSDMNQFCNECQSQGQSCSFPKIRQTPEMSVKEVHAHNSLPNTYGCFEGNSPNNRDIVEPARQNYYRRNVHNQGQCHCGSTVNRVCSGNGMELIDKENACSEIPSKTKLQMVNSNVLSPLDMAQINNQTVIDLYQIIHLQNEQILMLQQQVKQVLQIHLDCNKASLKQNCECQNSSSRPKNNQNCQSDINNHFGKNEEISGSTTVQEQKSSVKPDCVDRKRCSVGVMTSLTDENINHTNLQTNKGSNQAVITNTQNLLKQHQQPVSILPSGHHKKKSYHKRKTRCISTNSPKNQNIEDLKLSGRVDNSFSLNEAELVIRTPAEQEDSPNNSVHVDLQDYYTSTGSSESDTSGSSSGEDDSGESEPDESSDPQLGWTFYNQVVGQVNNILKKAPTSPQQGHTKMSRTAANPVGDVNGECETENNWSKRVTFDGPPLEDSDNNVQNRHYLPKFHRIRRLKEDLENDTNRGPNRRQEDFMMYNFANGNTNLSFSTLRYLERYQLLPSQMAVQMPGEKYRGYHKSSKQHKKKTKSRNPEVYSHLPRPNTKRRTTVPSSKLLDVTALKQQPKLF